MDDIDRVMLERVAEARRELDMARMLKLGHLIASPNDLFVVPMHRSLPNYITQGCVDAELVMLRQDTPASLALEGKIIGIENADPGYDWLFTRGIAGLVTQYGGTNSHMAIRCAEFGLPAAIGCGEQLFTSIRKSRRLVLNCRDKTVTVV